MFHKAVNGDGSSRAGRRPGRRVRLAAVLAATVAGALAVTGLAIGSSGLGVPGTARAGSVATQPAGQAAAAPAALRGHGGATDGSGWSIPRLPPVPAPPAPRRITFGDNGYSVTHVSLAVGQELLVTYRSNRAVPACRRSSGVLQRLCPNDGRTVRYRAAHAGTVTWMAVIRPNCEYPAHRVCPAYIGVQRLSITVHWVAVPLGR